MLFGKDGPLVLGADMKMRDALTEIFKMAQEHPSFDAELFETRDMEGLCEVGGDICDWTMIAILADSALKGRKT